MTSQDRKRSCGPRRFLARLRFAWAVHDRAPTLQQRLARTIGMALGRRVRLSIGTAKAKPWVPVVSSEEVIYTGRPESIEEAAAVVGLPPVHELRVGERYAAFRVAMDSPVLRDLTKAIALLEHVKFIGVVGFKPGTATAIVLMSMPEGYAEPWAPGRLVPMFDLIYFREKNGESPSCIMARRPDVVLLDSREAAS